MDGHPTTQSGIESLMDTIREVYENRLPFNRLLGLEVKYLKPDRACFAFPMRDELVGNYVHGILHGGVISAVLDATGGMTATASALGRLEGLDSKEVYEYISRVGTIDMRVDYLRPGKGTYFTSTGTIMRTGRKVAVTRTELKNQAGVLIAVGTGAYIVG